MALAPAMLVQDTWLSLVDGRLIARHWLPHADTLTHWTLGRSWVDQQWLAHLVLYEVAGRAGMVAALALGLLCVVGALVVLAFAARKLGATPSRTALGLLVPLVAAPWMVQLRAQSLALPLFAAVYALLVLDAKRPGRTVFWVFPLLVVWANVHGSVALGAGLVVLRGLDLIVRRSRRGLALVLGAPVAALATPYGWRLVAYYRLMLFHPPLASFVKEWQPAAFSAATAAFFATAFLLWILWGAHRRTLSAFETIALALLLVAGLLAVRNAVWFGLAAAVALPRLLDRAWPTRIDDSDAIRRSNRLLAGTVLSVLAVLAGVQGVRLPGAIQRAFPASAAAAVARAAGPNGIVLPDDAHADWLLWQQPSLTGRVAYDVRFELFDKGELQDLIRLKQGSQSVWRSCGSTARVVAFGSVGELQAVRRERVLAPGWRTVAAAPGFIAVRQTVRGDVRRCAL